MNFYLLYISRVTGMAMCVTSVLPMNWKRVMARIKRVQRRSLRRRQNTLDHGCSSRENHGEIKALMLLWLQNFRAKMEKDLDLMPYLRYNQRALKMGR